MDAESQKALSSHRNSQLDRFCRQYLQLLPDLDYPDTEYLQDENFQEDIYSRLFEENVLEYPPPHRYQLKTLKELTRKIENSIHDWEEQGISDNLMSHLSILLSTPIPSEATAAQQQSYVTYTLSSLPPVSSTSASPTPQAPTITILESASLLSGSGTTGLHAITPTASQNTTNKTSTFELTWGHVLPSGEFETFSEFLSSKSLSSSSTSAAGPKQTPLDLILAADVIYSPDVIPSLIATLEDLFDLYPAVEVLISSTIRNAETYAIFVEMCKKKGWMMERVDFVVAKKE
ncbi:hypothetical protein DID88_003305 [Monilinia fructigena]|uniref:FAM86 N-terminal domain-containing protein n=1 Tax=Monilinia fructigena TaxID=38457 RepID=A0A395IUY1_9HELO|nr:hypothetical protein DID88_003305 [Monilinia fructigena]